MSAAMSPRFWRGSRPMSRSTPCTARAARTASSRACWSCCAFPTPIPACWPRRSPANKDKAKIVMAAAGVPVAAGQGRHRASRRPRPMSCRRPMCSSRCRKARPMACSSSRRDLPSAAGAAAPGLALWRPDAGRKIHRRTRTHLRRDGRPALDVIEIKAAGGGWYDFNAKYAPGGSIHELPAKVKENIYQIVQELALKAHRALGCRGVSRTDFRYDDRPGGTGELVVLEVNTQPGMTETSLAPEMAAYAGISFGELVRWMVEDASCDR